MTDKIKIALSILLPYSLFCAGTWHTAYWSTFDINPFDYMGIDDIIKSFIYPFILSALTSIVINILTVHSGLKLFNPDTRIPTGPLTNKTLQAILTYIYIISLVLLTLLIENDRKWILLPSLYALPIVTYLTNNDKVIEYFPKYATRFMVISLFILMPSLSVSFAKVSSWKVKNNEKYHYTIQQDISKDTLKILGKLGPYMFFATKDNQRKYIKSMDKIEQLEIFEKK